MSMIPALGSIPSASIRASDIVGADWYQLTPVAPLSSSSQRDWLPAVCPGAVRDQRSRAAGPLASTPWTLMRTEACSASIQLGCRGGGMSSARCALSDDGSMRISGALRL